MPLVLPICFCSALNCTIEGLGVNMYMYIHVRALAEAGVCGDEVVDESH